VALPIKEVAHSFFFKGRDVYQCCVCVYTRMYIRMVFVSVSVSVSVSAWLRGARRTILSHAYLAADMLY
jgi:hypothetical protein